MTPPVRDPGPGGGGSIRKSRIPVLASVTKQLDFRGDGEATTSRPQSAHSSRPLSAATGPSLEFDHMRSVLKDLEGTAKQLKINQSKIPVRKSTTDQVKAPEQPVNYVKK